MPGLDLRSMYTLYKEMKEAGFPDGLDETLSENHGYPVQAHHLICCSVMEQLEGGKMAKLAIASGYDINNGNNGIALPAYFGHQRKETLPRHRGGHWDDYYKKVKTELAKVYKDHKDDKPCNNKTVQDNIKGDLTDLEDLIRTKLTKRQWWLYDWSEELWSKDYRDEGATNMKSPRKRDGSSSSGQQWAATAFPGGVKRRHKVTGSQTILLSDWYSKKYGYPEPGGPTS
jgi:hypothetical protein